MISYRHKPPELVGGALCVDFANTVTWRGDPEDCGERLTSFDELLAWAVAAGAVDRKQAASIAARSAANPSKSAAALADAILLREAIARLLERKSDSAAAVDLATINAVLLEAPPQTALAKQGGRFGWLGADKADPLRLILVKVARSAAEVLTSDQLEMVSSCGDERCGWLFIDNSRTGERRWCNMKTCGNRAKARLHYRRARRRPPARSRAR
jgi:predicted RNA-binding Zn ribbon-like protein